MYGFLNRSSSTSVMKEINRKMLKTSLDKQGIQYIMRHRSGLDVERKDN